MIADDHEIVRRGIRSLLESEPGYEVVAEARTGREAVRKAKQLDPDIAIIDVSMPDLNGLEATDQIRRQSPRTKIVILTMHDAEPVVNDILLSGALGYVLKSDASNELLSALHAVRNGKPFFPGTVGAMLLQGYRNQRDRGAPERRVLTPREREIVQLLAEGKTNKEVATALGITVKTAETHRSNIFRKLDLHSIPQLVRYAIRNHVIEV
jgi:DNA-binding NarL/FixJ family response regulator